MAIRGRPVAGTEEQLDACIRSGLTDRLLIIGRLVVDLDTLEGPTATVAAVVAYRHVVAVVGGRQSEAEHLSV